LLAIRLASSSVSTLATARRALVFIVRIGQVFT